MSILQSSSLLVMGELVRGALRHLGGGLGEAVSSQAVGLLQRQFSDHSQRLTVALRRASDRSWRALEIALEGESLWRRLKQKVTTSADERAFAAQVGQYLQGVPLTAAGIDRASCLTQLRAARQAGALADGALTPEALAGQADQFARFRDPVAQLQREMQAGQSIAEALRPGYPHLAALLTVQAREGGSLYALGLRYFFRRAIEEDEQLARGLAFAQFDKLQADQEHGFSALHEAMQAAGDRLGELLGEVAATVRDTHANVLDLRHEQEQHGQQLRAMYDAVVELQKRFDLARAEVRPQDSLSIRSDEERQLVKQLVERFRALPPEQRRQAPALLNGLGKLEIAAGDFEGAGREFAIVAGLVSDGPARGEAHHNAYRAALERREWGEALQHLQKAIAVDAARFAPLPVDKYRPERILGAGGFGVAYLCQHSFLKTPVVVKTLSESELARGVDAVFAEAQVLTGLNHPTIIRVQDCGFTDAARRARPYLAMEYFDGASLEDLVQKKGPLAERDALAVVWQIAAGLEAAHARGVLHRDVKPANVLVKRAESEWEVKLIDFGLAVRNATAGGLAAYAGTLAGASIAGTLDYAAPEQIGKLPGVAVSPRSDIYGLARTFCYALFGTPSPRGKHWDSLSRELKDFLEVCLADQPEERPADVNALFGLLGKVRSRKPAAEAKPASGPRPAVAPAPARPPAPPPPQLEEAEKLLASLTHSFDAGKVQRLALLVRWLEGNAPGQRTTALGAQARALIEAPLRGPEPVMGPVAGQPLQAAPDPRKAAALTWHFLVSFRGRPAESGGRP